MSIPIRCSGCAKKLAVKDAFAGRRVKCPGCGQVIAVPTGAAPPTAMTAKSARSSAAAPVRSAPPPPAAPIPASSRMWLWAAVGGGTAALIAVAAVTYLWFIRDQPAGTPVVVVKQPHPPENAEPGFTPPPEKKVDPETKPEPNNTPEAKPESKSPPPEAKPETKPAPMAKPAPTPAPVPGQVTPPPELKQSVKSIRVVLAEPLARDRILKTLRAAYEPFGVKIVIGRTDDKEPIQEDVALIATHFSQAAGMFTPANESAWYLWVDMQRELIFMVDQRGSSSILAPMDGVNPPQYLFDPTPFIDLRVETRSGIPTNDLKYVLFREGRGPETVAVYDTTKKDVVTKHKVQGQWSSRLILGDELLCSINDKGLELFDLAGLPALGKSHAFFASTDSNQIKDVIVHGRNVIALIDGKLQVVHWAAGGQPRVAFADNAKSGLLQWNSTGQLRLYAAAKEGSGNEPVDVRSGHVATNGEVKLDAPVSSKSIDGDDPSWRADTSGCLRAQLLWFNNGRLQLWWHGDPAQPRHLCDLPMVSGSKVTAKGVKGLPQWQGKSLMLAGPLLANFAQDYGVRRLPNGQLLVYYGGTVLRLKHFPHGAAPTATGPSSTVGSAPPPRPMPTKSGSGRDLLPLTGPPVDRGVALQRFTKLLPTEESVKWLKALAATTGRDNNTLFLQCVSAFGHKTGAMFADGKFQPAVSAKLLQRLGSISRDDFRAWHGAFNQVMGQPCSDVAVALLLVAADPLFDGDAYAAAQGHKFLNRLKQLKRDAVERWCKSMPAFRDDELDAALTISVRDDCFAAEAFDRKSFDALLEAQ